MIENPPLLQVRRRFARPPPAEVAAFAGLPTGFVVDALGGGGGLDGRIKPIGAATAFCGVALTCDAGPADNLAAFGALSLAEARRRHRLCRRRLRADGGHRRPPPRHDEEPRRRRLRDRRPCARHRRHPRGRAPLLRRRRDAQLAGPQRTRDGRPAGGRRRRDGRFGRHRGRRRGRRGGGAAARGSARRSPASPRSRPPRPPSMPGCKAGLEVPDWIQAMIDAGQFHEVD